MEASFRRAMANEEATLRQLEPQWNRGMIAASIAISLLGAFTSTQLFVSYCLSYFLYSGNSKNFPPVCAKPGCPFNSQASLLGRS